MTPHPVPAPPEKSKRVGPDWWLMLRKFLRHGTAIASFSPSSRFLARSILKGIDFAKAKVIVELGAGTGPITAELIKRARPGTKLIIIELDADFCKRLRQRFPGHDVVEGDAAKLDQILAERGIDKADHVVSGLPLPSFPKDLCRAIIASSMKVLTAGGDFRQITNMPWVYKRMYRKYFSEVRFRFVPLNLPPGGVYVCKGYGALAA